MSLLARLLQARNPLFTLTLQQLESETMRRGRDVELIGEIVKKAHGHAKSLGLEVPDYTAQELYYGLIARVKKDNERLSRALGGKDPSNVSEMIPKIIDCVNGISLERRGWFLKESVAKRMIQAMPPQNVMRRLGYKSVGQLLAKESIYEIYGALRFAEPPEWLEEFIKQYKELSFKDFTPRDIKIISYDADKWGDIAKHFIEKKLHNITHLKELGVILAMPMHIPRMQGITLKMLPLLIHYIYEIRLYSAFFKLNATKRNFGEIVVDTLIADPSHVEVTAGTHIHWRVIQRYFGKLEDEVHPEIFEPHVQPEDLHWRKAEEVLYNIDPQLEFWKDMDYVGVIIGDQTVTFNLMDVALSYSNGLEFGDRYLYHFREALWNEIFMRYLGVKTLRERILMKLDNELIAPEEIVAQAKRARR